MLIDSENENTWEQLNEKNRNRRPVSDRHFFECVFVLLLFSTLKQHIFFLIYFTASIRNLVELKMRFC